MEQGPDRLRTEESEDYDPDSADEAMIAVEISKLEEDQMVLLGSEINIFKVQEHVKAFSRSEKQC